MARYLTNLAGAFARSADAKEVIRQLSEGDTLELIRTPDNKYDSNAIQIHCEYEGDSYWLGFCQAIMNRPLAEEFDAHCAEHGNYDLPYLARVSKVYESIPGKNDPQLAPLIEILTGEDMHVGAAATA